MEDVPAQETKMRKLPLVPITIVVIFLLLFGVLYLVLSSKPSNQRTDSADCINCKKETPKSTDMSQVSWVPYTNSQYGFSIDYPSLFTTQMETTDTGIPETRFVSSVLGDSNTSSANAMEVTVTYHPSIAGQTLRAWLDEQTTIDLDGKKESLLTDTIKPYMVGSLEGYYFIGGAEKVSKQVFVQSGNYNIGFTLSGAETGTDFRNIPNAEKTFDQMLTTFNRI